MLSLEYIQSFHHCCHHLWAERLRFFFHIQEMVEMFGPLSFKKKKINLNYNFLLRIKMLMCIVQDQKIYQVLSYIILKLGSLSSVMDWGVLVYPTHSTNELNCTSSHAFRTVSLCFDLLYYHVHLRVQNNCLYYLHLGVINSWIFLYSCIHIHSNLYINKKKDKSVLVELWRTYFYHILVWALTLVLLSEMFVRASEVFLQSSSYIYMYINSMAIFGAENFSSSTSTSFKKR